MAKSRTLIEKDLWACPLGKMGHGYDYMQIRPLDYKDNSTAKIGLGCVQPQYVWLPSACFSLGSQ